MTTSQILLYALLIILLYLVYTYSTGGSSYKLTSLLSASTPYVVSEDSVKVLNNNQSIFNYTVSVWVYVDNWKVNPSETKHILTIPDALSIYLGGTDNTLFVDVYPFAAESYANLAETSARVPLAATEALTSLETSKKKQNHESMTLVQEGYSKVSTSATAKNGNKREGFAESSYTGSKMMVLGTEAINKYTAYVPSIPLQAWTNITVGIHDRAVDIYINGKLNQSNLFPFVPGPVKTSIKLTESPGFSGWTSNLEYYPYSLTPSKIDSIYKSGYTGAAESVLSLLGRYSVKVVFVDNTQK